MTNEIIEAISQKLEQLFPDWHKYAQDTLQNIELPCFIIKLAGSNQHEMLGPRARLTETYSVSLICPDDVHRLRYVLELASVALRFIDLPDGRPIMALNRNAQVIDDETANITFSISRTAWLKPVDDPKQEKLVHKIGVKDDQQ